MTSILAFIAIVIVSMIIALIALYTADKVASALANKASANKSESAVVVRRWNWFGVTTHVTSSKEIWHNIVYSTMFNVVFKSVMWGLTTLLSTGAKRIKSGAY